jgi:hypothetical protein
MVLETRIDSMRQLYGVPHGILRVFNTILYENEFPLPDVALLPIR